MYAVGHQAYAFSTEQNICGWDHASCTGPKKSANAYKKVFEKSEASGNQNRLNYLA